MKIERNDLLKKLVVDVAERKGITLKEFCDRNNIMQGTLTNMFMGRSNVSSKLFNAMVKSGDFTDKDLIKLRNKIEARRMAKFLPIPYRV